MQQKIWMKIIIICTSLKSLLSRIRWWVAGLATQEKFTNEKRKKNIELLDLIQDQTWLSKLQCSIRVTIISHWKFNSELNFERASFLWTLLRAYNIWITPDEIYRFSQSQSCSIFVEKSEGKKKYKASPPSCKINYMAVINLEIFFPLDFKTLL